MFAYGCVLFSVCLAYDCALCVYVCVVCVHVVVWLLYGVFMIVWAVLVGVRYDSLCLYVSV